MQLRVAITGTCGGDIVKSCAVHDRYGRIDGLNYMGARGVEFIAFCTSFTLSRLVNS